jgi:hypothetical protein
VGILRYTWNDHNFIICWLPQVVPFLRRCTELLYEHLQLTKGEGYSTKALAHVLLALGEMGARFETVYPLVLLIMDILQQRTETLDITCGPQCFALNRCEEIVFPTSNYCILSP